MKYIEFISNLRYLKAVQRLIKYFFVCFTCIFFCFQLQAAIRVNGAGASFPYPIYARWISEFNQLQDDYRFNYQSIGSGGGIRQFTNRTVHFGASDAPVNDQIMAQSDREILHVPTVMGSVTVAYNLEGVPSGLKLTGELLAEIFMGNIDKWNHPSITSLNPNLDLPDNYIMPVRRADGSGTTDVFSDYLNKVSPKWAAKMGRGTALRWPVKAIGARGNEGVTGMLRQIPGAIGYIELAYARQFNFPTVALQNAAGEFVEPSTEAVSASGLGLSQEEYYGDYRLSITNSDHPEAYPISAFTYILIPSQAKTEQDVAVRKFLQWSLNDGQIFAPDLHYAPLPKKLASIILKRLDGANVEELINSDKAIDQKEAINVH